MGQHKQFGKQTVLISITQFLISLSSLILIPILTKNLHISEYGIWLQVMITINFIPMFASLGLPYAMVRFLASEKDKDVIQEDFYSILTIVALSSGVASLILLFFADLIASFLLDKNTFIARIMAITIFILSIQSVLINFFRTFQQIKCYSAFIFIKQYLMIGCVSGMILAGFGINGAVGGLFIAELFITVVIGSLILKTIGIKKPRFRGIKEKILFGLPTVPSNLSNWVVNSSDRYLIGIILGNTWVGYYGPGYALGNLIRIFISPISFLLPAVLSNEFDKGNKNEVKQYLTYSLKYFLIFAIPAFVGISLLSKSILTILSTPDIAAKAFLITPLIASSCLLFGVYSILAKHFMLEKNTMFTCKVWMGAAVLNFGLNLIFIPYFGIIGAAFTTLFAFGFALYLVKHYSPQMIDSQNVIGFVMKSILSTLFMSIIIIVLEPRSIIQIISTVIICAAVYFIILFVLKAFTKEEIKYFRSFFRFN